MKMRKNNIRDKWLMRLAVVALLLQSAICNLQFSSLKAQEVSILVSPVQQVLPPQAGQYIDNPGKFFNIHITNNTDDQQLLHLGMHIDMTYPEPQAMVVTPSPFDGTSQPRLPRTPIVVPPRQTKILNPVEMKQLFNHFVLEEIYIRDGLYSDYRRGIYGLLPEGQYELFLQAYRWDPTLTSAAQLNAPDNGSCRFTVCYTAQAPSFIMPIVTGGDPFGTLTTAKLDVNAPLFAWTQPTLNCNPTLMTFNYSVKIVRLDGLTADEAIEKNAVVYSRERLTTTTLTLPQAYVMKMEQESAAYPGTIYAMQVTAHSNYSGRNSLNFSMIENEGRSPVLLFTLYDPDRDAAETVEERVITPDDNPETGIPIPDLTTKRKDSLYVFEQPTLTKPTFPTITARKIFVGEDIKAEWRQAWFAGGWGLRQDTIKFEYTMQLFKGNSADEPDMIFKQKPVYEKSTKELEGIIAFEDIEDKVGQGDYLVFRVTAKALNEPSIRMLPDSANYKDFYLTRHVGELLADAACGTNTANVTNKTPVASCPKGGTKVRIGDWTLELNEDVKQDASTKALSGTGWVSWMPGTMQVRVAVMFDKLMVNTDSIVYDGTCVTYPKDKSFESQDAVDQLFSDWGLDNFWGDIAIGEEGRLKVTDERGDIAKKLELGKYYSYFKKGQNQWKEWKAGKVLDLYFPTELPDEIANKLPDDFSLQIASIQYSPKGAVMNVIGEFVLPKVDVIKNEVLIFGAPRLCMQKDRLFPEDGTLALLSNFTIKDPDSDFDLTFKSPAEPLNPQDGCFVSWKDDEFGGLGIEVAMHIPNLDRVVDGKVQQGTPPICNLKAVIDDTWDDWMGTVTMGDFQVCDLPGWTFTPGNTIIYDHSNNKNDNDFPFKSVSDVTKRYGDTYDPSLCGSRVRSDWKAWQGLYIDEVNVQFPQWAVFGTGKKGATFPAQKIIYDDSGLSLDIKGRNILNAETGEAGGWKFSIDSCVVKIVQNNFNNCHITGQFAVPLFGKDNKQVDFVCDIRHLTDPSKSETYYTYEQKYDSKGKALQGQYETVKHTRKTYGDNSRYAYLFRTSQKLDLQMDFLVATLDLDHKQTFFALAAEEQTDGKTKTDLELCIGGDLSIAKTDGMKIRFPGIHFTKLYVSNFKRSEATKANNMVLKYDKELGGLESRRQEAEKEWESKYKKLKVLMADKEIELGSSCYVNFGEWSLASVQKKLGPFKFTLDKWGVSFDVGTKKLGLSIDGSIGLVNGMVDVGAGIDITSTLEVGKTSDLSTYKLTKGQISFRDIDLNVNFANALKLNGLLKMDELNIDKGYKGELNIDIIGLFGVKCKGGFLQHIGATAAEIAKLKAEALGKGLSYDPDDANYPWGYFTCDISSGAGIQIPPLAINRIAGGFYFNSRPKVGSDPIGEYGLTGISLGCGLQSSAGASVLSADLDLSVVYNFKANCMSTFLFKGNVNAVSGMVNGNMTLLYENNKTDRFLELDISVETGLSAEKLAGIVGASGVLKEIKADLDKFQSGMDSKIREFSNDTNGSLDEMLGDDSESKSVASQNTGGMDAAASAKQQKSQNNRFGQVEIPFNLKFTWKQKSMTYSTPRWHLYLGKPQKEERCKFILIDYRSPGGIVNVNIGADGYLCIGNELPGNGQLPPIPQEIQNFISPGGVDTNADMSKAERQRNAAAHHLQPTEGNVNGGVMVGASAWGFIDINLGLFYGGLKAIAGFDMSLVHYDPPSYCVNLGRTMGKNGWYAQGQFYAYLAAKFGLHIKLGMLIDKKIDIVNAGIGGVFAAGLPSPSWIEGQARVKLRLLGGLVNINKKFSFESGQYCQAFLGNALDGFSLFDELTVGTDSLDGWDYDKSVTVQEAKRAIITTEASLNSQYRLVDPNTQKSLADNFGEDPEKLKQAAARTYIFDIETTRNSNYGISGVRLFEFTKTQANRIERMYGSVFNRMTGPIEMNRKMRGLNLERGVLQESSNYTQMEGMIKQFKAIGKEVTISTREKQGTKYHFNMNLQPDRYYLMMLTGTGYEVLDARRVWPYLYVQNDAGAVVDQGYYQWLQRRMFFFNTKSEADIPNYIEDLQPYVALAMPAGPNCELNNNSEDGDLAYREDLANPTIALNRDISQKAYKDGKLKWVLERQDTKNSWSKAKDTQENVWVKSGSNYLSMKPKKPLNVWNGTFTAANQQYNLKLTYTWQIPYECDSKGSYNIDGRSIDGGSATPYDSWYVIKQFFSEKGCLSDFYSWLASVSIPVCTSSDVNDSGYTMMVLGAAVYVTCNKPLDEEYKAYMAKHQTGKGTCYRDTTVVLANWYFKEADRTSWQRGAGKYKSNFAYELLPYEKPFVGVRPDEPPTFAYGALEQFQHENVKCYESKAGDDRYGYTEYGGKNYRMLDPWLYFSYLSSWVFITGDYVYRYSFDDIGISHATETLTFTCNNTDIQGDAQIYGLQSSMFSVRNKMYKAWNNWNFGSGHSSYFGYDANQPMYPLPEGKGDVYERTMMNQDGKAGTYYPSDAKNDSYPWVAGLRTFLWNFAAPYKMAEAFSVGARDVAKHLHSLYLQGEPASDRIYRWNVSHRGNYMLLYSDVKDHGHTYKVKVPYYQFPLIYGNCFDVHNGQPGYCVETGQVVQRENRSFSWSLRGRHQVYDTPTSCLLYWRLMGGYPFLTKNVNKYSSKKYNGVTRKYVEWEKFNTKNALNQVTSLKLKMYRVNAYNMDNGQYYPWVSVGPSSEDFRPRVVDVVKDVDSPLQYKLGDICNDMPVIVLRKDGGDEGVEGTD